MKIDLLQMVESGGCSAKIPPKQLEEILKYLPLPEDPDGSLVPRQEAPAGGAGCHRAGRELRQENSQET
jgi:hypothetical protein